MRAAFAIGQLLTHPNGRKGICRQRLHASVTQRDKHQAARISHARHRRDGAHKLGALSDIAGFNITLIERIASHDKEIVASSNRFGDIRGPVGRLLKLGDPFFLGGTRGGRGLGSTRSGRRPRAAPIRTLSTRVDDNAIDLSRRLLKVIEVNQGQGIARLNLVARDALRGRFAVDVEAPATRVVGRSAKLHSVGRRNRLDEHAPRLGRGVVCQASRVERLLNEVPSSGVGVGGIRYGNAIEPGVLHRRRGIRILDAYDRNRSDLVLGPFGMQGDIAGNGCREVVGLRALRIGVPACERVAFARGIVRIGGRLAVLDLLRGNRGTLARIERHGVRKHRKAVKVTVFDGVTRLDDILRRADTRHSTVDVERPIAIGGIPIGAKNATVLGLQRRQAQRVGLEIGAAGVLENLLEHILCSLVVIILNGNLSQRHNGLGRALGIASVARKPRRASCDDNRLSGIGIFDASCAQNRQRCRNILVGKFGIDGVVGIALGVAGILLARQARRNRNLRVVLRLRDP